MLIVGTSLQVYPAAGLIDFVLHGTKIYYVDPFPAIESRNDLTVIAEKATIGVQRVADLLSGY
jgi:NAD-dependent deacetylase